MLIKALCDYADKLSEKTDGQVIPDGWSEQEISLLILLTPDGDIAEIADIRETKEIVQKNGRIKEIHTPVKRILPKRTQKTSVCSNIIEHRPLYIFGLNLESDVYTSMDRTKKALKSHEDFVKCNLAFFEDLDSEMCTAYRNFIKKWVPEAETENPHLTSIRKLYKNSYFCFGLDAHPEIRLENDEAFCRKYASYLAEQEKCVGNDDSLAFCGITGEKLPIARIHEKIKFPGGNSSGCVLVGMKESAFESYGKTQSYNSNISEDAMKKYTSALNLLLADKKHHIQIGDVTIVYFAMKSNDSQECSTFSWFFDNSDNTEANLNSIYQSILQGNVGDLSAFGIDKDVTFYVAGMTANSSRICQKFIYHDKFGNLLQNLMRHQADMKISSEQKRQIAFWQIAKELVSPKSTNQKVPPPLLTAIMLAAFQGTRYPEALLSTVIRRVKTDSDDIEKKNYFIKLNDVRAGIIKACLNRKYKREEITMALNENNLNPAYLCGRLFAVLEKIQQDSSSSRLNRTIKDAYFSSACSRPAAIFPKLVQLSEKHSKKLSERSGIYYQNLKGDIINGLEGTFPQTLTLDEQGRFIVGYYQQNKVLYTPKNKEN